MNYINRSLLAASILLVSNIAVASTTTWTWNLDDSVGANEVLGNDNGDSSLLVDGTNTSNGSILNADIAAFSDTGGAHDDVLEAGNYHYYNNNSWGVVNQDESLSDNPGHAFDNLDQGTVEHACEDNQTHSSLYDDKCYTRGSNNRPIYVDDFSYEEADYDMALISFDTSVELTDIEFGYRSDGDFTLLAYVGDPLLFTGLGGSTWADQNNSGDWLTVGNYNGGPVSSYYAVNDTGINAGTSSQYWLLGAYNSIFGGPTESGVDANDDAFKVRKLRGNTTEATEVSTPSAFSLLIMGLGGIYLRRNRKS